MRIRSIAAFCCMLAAIVSVTGTAYLYGAARHKPTAKRAAHPAAKHAKAPAAKRPAPRKARRSVAPATPASMRVAARPSNAKALTLGKSLVLKNHCASCHGYDLAGLRNTPSLLATGVLKDYDRSTFARLLTTGIDAHGHPIDADMPKFVLKPAESGAMFEYLRSFRLTKRTARLTKAASPPAIDGAGGDPAWTKAPSNKIVKLMGQPEPKPLASSWKGVWTADNLYLLVDVGDDSKFNDSSNPWDDDSVEVYLDPNGNGGSSYDPDDRQYIFGWNDDRVVEGGHRDATGVGFARTDPTARSYRMEIVIPWSDAIGRPAPGKTFGIDVLINDDDHGGGRDRKFGWNDSSDTAYRDPSRFGIGKLVP